MKRLLEDPRFDASRIDYDRGTAVHYAAMNDHEDMIKLLHESGRFQMDSLDVHGRGPLSYAALHGHGGVVRLLVKIYKEIGGISWNVADEDGASPETYARKAGYEDLAAIIAGGECPSDEDMRGSELESVSELERDGRGSI